MPPKKKPGKKRAAPKPKTKADRKHYKGNGGARCKEDEIPVKRKKRKTQSASSSPRPPSTHTPPDGKRTKGATTPPPNAQSKEEAFVPSRAFMLAAAVLCGCDHGIWYRLAPDLEKRDDLSVATRHSWQNIFATFIHQGSPRQAQHSNRPASSSIARNKRPRFRDMDVFAIGRRKKA